MEIFISRDGKELGPYSPREIRDRIASGQLQRSDLAWYEGAADWMPLSEVRLPAEEEAALVPVKVSRPLPVAVQNYAAPVPVQRATKNCPFCAEHIMADALKCKHCGELLDPRLRAAEESRRAAQVAVQTAVQPPPPSRVDVKVNVGNPSPVIVVREKKPFFSGCGCLLLLIIALFIFFAIVGQHPR